MSRRRLIRTCFLLAVTTHASCQYIDFFQSFNSFLQPLATTKPRNDATKRPDTKHRQTTKQKYQDVIFFETDDILKRKENSRTVDPFGLFPTTAKPRRKTTKTTTSHNLNAYTTQSPDYNKPNKTVNSNKIINTNRNGNREVIRSISSNNREPYNNNVDNRLVDNGRRIDNYNGYNDNGYNYGSNSDTTSNNIYGYQSNNFNTNNRQTTQRTTVTTNYYNNNGRQTTRKTTTGYDNNARPTTRKTTDFYNNQRQTTRLYKNERTTKRPSNNGDRYPSRTTSNPLLNRPGVKPAAVDENKPPITNRPVTARPVYDRPNKGTFIPVNTRPPYETERPILPNRPPVNTRPPFGVERPISTGIVRPIPGFNQPDTLGNRPAVSNNEDVEPDIEIGPDEDDMSESEKRRLYDICEQKCDEYKSARVKKVVALPLSPNYQGVEVNVSTCPIKNIPLIIGGEVVRIEQFPHMALVGWKKIQNAGYSWKCGGSLVSEQYILTAGHCTYHDKDYNVVRYYGPPHAVQLGSSLYDDRSATVAAVAAVVRHPKYKLRRSYYDVALIKMTRTASFSNTISPACLGVPPPVGDPIIATGWGKTEYGGDSSIELRSVSIPVWDMADCREIWGTSLKLPNGPMSDNQICAGERKGAKDTCQGDSGGPAQVQDGCSWRVVAVTSVGRSCGAPETPALYATIPRAFIAAQVFTNAKSGRDGNNQYGNEGINVNNNNNNNNNRGNENNNWNNGNGNLNSGIANSNRGNNDQYGNQATIARPIQNNNGNYYGGSQASGTDNRGVVNNNNNGGNNGNNNNWSVPDTTTNNRYNQNNGNNNNQNNRNVNEQISYGNNGQYVRTTTTVRYNNNGQNGYNNANNYGQSGYNNEQNQNVRITQDPFNSRNSGTQSYGYNDNGNNNNGNTGIAYNGYNNNPVANQPWWGK